MIGVVEGTSKEAESEQKTSERPNVSSLVDLALGRDVEELGSAVRHRATLAGDVLSEQRGTKGMHTMG